MKEILQGRILNLIFHLHAAELRHFGGHVLKYSSHNMETSSRVEFVAVGLKSNNCSVVSHAIVRETMTAITIQSLASGVNISNMTRLFPAEDPNQNFPSLRFYSTAWILQRWQYVFACSYFLLLFLSRSRVAVVGRLSADAKMPLILSSGAYLPIRNKCVIFGRNFKFAN